MYSQLRYLDVDIGRKLQELQSFESTLRYQQFKIIGVEIKEK